MKISPLIFLFSLAGNVALVALVLTVHPANDGISPNTPAGSRAAQTRAGGAASANLGAATSVAVDPALWAGLAAGDLPAFVARLREAGFPPALVRAIAGAQLNESFTARRKALQPSKENIPFWKTDQPTDPKTLAALRELGREQSKAMKDLLGAPAREDDPGYAATLRRQYGDLPREKIDQIVRVKDDYNELRQEIYTAAGMGGGVLMAMTPEDRAKLALLEKEQRADIAQLLSPKELEDYELRSSNTANMMRSRLSAFNPSEEEFRTLFKLQSAFDEQYNVQNLIAAQGTPAAQELMRQRTEAQKQLIAQVKAALGAERGVDYERSIDGNFQQISRVVDRLELPGEAAVQVWNLQKEIEQRANALRADRTLPSAARNEQLAALTQEATTKVGTALGQRGLEVYKQNGGYWLQNLQPRSAPAAGGGGGVAPASGTRGMIIPPSR